MALKGKLYYHSLIALGLAGTIGSLSSLGYHAKNIGFFSAPPAVQQMYDIEYKFGRLTGKEMLEGMLESPRFDSTQDVADLRPAIRYAALFEEYKTLKSNPPVMQEREKYELDDKQRNHNIGLSLGSLMLALFSFTLLKNAGLYKKYILKNPELEKAKGI